MYYKVRKNSDLQEALIKVYRHGVAATEDAKALAREIAGKEDVTFYTPFNSFAGGIVAIDFEKVKDIPSGWTQFHSSYPAHVCKPSDSMIGKKIQEKLDQLKVIPRQDVNQLLGFKPVSTPDGKHTNSPGLTIHPPTGNILIDMPVYIGPELYIPTPDIIEILGSEFHKLMREMRSYQEKNRVSLDQQKDEEE